MTSSRFLSVVGAFAVFIGACGGRDGGTSTGSGGTTGMGGANSSGGSSGTGTGGTAGSPGTGGAVFGTGGQAAGGRDAGDASTGGSSGSGGGEVPEARARAVPSKGCGVTSGAKTLTTGGMSVMSALPTSTRLTMTSGGMNREYIIDIPADYEPTHPYRLIFSWYQAFGSDTGNANGLHPAVMVPTSTQPTTLSSGSAAKRPQRTSPPSL